MSAQPAVNLAHTTAPQSMPNRPLSLLIGFADDGQAIYAHVAFDVPVKKGFLTRLGDQLIAMEESLGEPKGRDKK